MIGTPLFRRPCRGRNGRHRQCEPALRALLSGSCGSASNCSLVQQKNRRRVFRPGRSVKDGESIYLYSAIKSRVFTGRSFPWAWANNGNDASITEITSALRKTCKRWVRRGELK